MLNQQRILDRLRKILGSKLTEVLIKLLQSDINRKILSGSFWVLSGTVISKGLMLLSSIIVARILGAEQYGEVGIIRSTVNMFAVFAGLGVGLTVTKFIAELKVSDPDKALRIIRLSNFLTLAMALVVVLLIIVFSKNIAIQINAIHLDDEIRLGAIILFFNVLCGIQSGVLAGFEAFKEIARNNLWAGLMSFFIQIILTYFGGIFGAIIGLGFNYFILWFFNRMSVSKLVATIGKLPPFLSSLSELNVFWTFSLPAVLSGVLVGPVFWICNVFLVNQPNGYTQMALFDAANQWRMTMLFIPTALAQIILPLMSSTVSNTAVYREVFFKSFKVNLGITVFLFICILAVSPIIIYTYGPEFTGLFTPLIILVFSTIFIAVNNVIGQYLASQDKMWVGFGFNLVWGVILILASFYFVKIKDFGVNGLALSYCLSYLLHSLLQYSYLKYKIFPNYES